MHIKARRHVFTVLASLISALALSLAFVPAATAAGPTEPIDIGGTGNTITGVYINGVHTTEATVQPGSTISMQATLTLGSGANPGWWYEAAYGWDGAQTYSGCSVPTYVGWPETTNFTLTAPSAAGTYNVHVNLGPDPCPWLPAAGTVIAEIHVAATYDSVCAAVENYSTSADVATGLCDKLYAAQAAENVGDMKAKANILNAFVKQVNAQTGKALTSDQAANLIGFVAQL